MKNKQVEKQVRRRYSAEFKKQALMRAERDGAAVAAKDLGLSPNQLYTWRMKERAIGQVSEERRLAQSENAGLKRELSRLEEENAFLKKRRCTSRGSRNEVRHDQSSRREVSTRLMCRVLSVSSSGYYDWRSLDERVRHAFHAEKCRADRPG